MINCEFEDGGKVSLRHAVVNSLVLKDNKILLVKRSAKLLEGGKWGLAGGFMDRDETLKEAAEREIFEETGWRVKNIQLLTIIDKPSSQREDRQNISFVYFCTATEKTGEADWESDEQKWFPLTELPAKESIAFDHAECIDLYMNYLSNDLSLPVTA
jgi:8-oxo-dGTP diphosphatase